MKKHQINDLLNISSFQTEEDHSQIDGASPQLSQAKLDRRSTPLVLPAAPSNLTQSQLKRRHIISAIVHSENSYVSSLQRLVKVSCKLIFIINYCN